MSITDRTRNHSRWKNEWFYVCGFNEVSRGEAQNKSPSLEMNGGLGSGFMESWANKRKKHAIVYLLGAPLVFWAQLLQKKQINYPQRGRGERQRDKSNTRLMKDGKIKDTNRTSAGASCGRSLPLFLWEKARSRSTFLLPLWGQRHGLMRLLNVNTTPRQRIVSLCVCVCVPECNPLHQTRVVTGQTHSWTSSACSLGCSALTGSLHSDFHSCIHKIHCQLIWISTLAPIFVGVFCLFGQDLVAHLMIGEHILFWN